MKKPIIIVSVIFLIAIVLCTGIVAAKTEKSWNKTYTVAPMFEYQQAGLSIAQTQDNGYIMAGIAGGQARASKYDFNVPVIKVDAYGNEQWKVAYSDEGNGIFPCSIFQTHDKSYVMGGTIAKSTGLNSFTLTHYDAFLAKVDVNGNKVWQKTIETTNDEYIYSVIETQDKGILIAGITIPPPMPQQTLPPIIYGQLWLAKTDANGNIMWTKTCSEAGNILGIGYSWKIAETQDKGYVIASTINAPTGFGYDVQLIKLDALGNSQWVKQFDKSVGDVAFSVIETSDHNLVISAYANHYPEPGFATWLIKTDSSGNELWNKTYIDIMGSPFISNSLIETSDKGFALCPPTNFVSTSLQTYTDAYLLKISRDGTQEWVHTFGGQNEDVAVSLIQAKDKGFVLAGWSGDAVAFEYSMWIVKTDTYGNI